MFPMNAEILIVDDMQSLREQLRGILTKNGYTNVSEAADGQQAQQLISTLRSQGKTLNLIICDWNMPMVNGYDLLVFVRAFDDIKNTPFIMITTENERDKVLKAILAGIDHFMLKPIVEETLLEKMKFVWAKRNTPP